MMRPLAPRETTRRTLAVVLVAAISRMLTWLEFYLL